MFVRMVRLLHDGMMARVNFGGKLSETFPVENGVQGDLDAPTFFVIYFGAMLHLVYSFTIEHQARSLTLDVFFRAKKKGFLLYGQRFAVRRRSLPHQRGFTITYKLF